MSNTKKHKKHHRKSSRKHLPQAIRHVVSQTLKPVETFIQDSFTDETCEKWGGFWSAVLKRKMFPLPAVLLAFPSLTVLFASLGFLFGFGVSATYGILG